jgi:hypothetical protein
MRDLLVLAVPSLVLAICYCLWRAVTLMTAWRSALATVTKSDYDRDQQREDFWSFGFTAVTSRGWNWRDGKGGRWIEDEVTFADAEGRSRRLVVPRRVRRGWQPKSVFKIWYDPCDSDRVTSFGPGHWLLLALLWSFGLATVFRFGLEMATFKY